MAKRLVVWTLLTVLLSTNVVGYVLPSWSTCRSRSPSFVGVAQLVPWQLSPFQTIPTTGLFLSVSSTAPQPDGDSLQEMFQNRCDSDGLMGFDGVKAVPDIAELLEEESLLPKELENIWNAAPKFPTDESKIDVDSFIQIYRDIDDLFEDDEEDHEADVESNGKRLSPKTDDDEDEQDMTTVFGTLCNPEKLVTKEILFKWEEIQKLLQDGLLGENEFDSIWAQTQKAPGTEDSLDVEGFLSFNVALDDLFVFEEEGNENQLPTSLKSADPKQHTPQMVSGDDLSPNELFAALANENNLIGRVEMKRWEGLKEMITDGDLTSAEFEAIYKKYAKDDKLDEASFVSVYRDVDDLFEEVDDDEDETSYSAEPSAKPQLLLYIKSISRDSDRLPCGLDSTEDERSLVLDTVTALEKEPDNIVKQRDGDVRIDDVKGDWELLFTSSSTLLFNKGLSGLARNFPNGKFGGLRQNLKATKVLTDAEYIERIEMNPAVASFDVRIVGDWYIDKAMNFLTGEPSTILTVDPIKVEYGVTSQSAEYWKSLGPMNKLDLTYLDGDLRIMRASARENVYVFKRIS